MKKITILFQSGSQISFHANDFSVIENKFGRIVEVKWDCEGSNIYPLSFNTENIDVILVEEVDS